VLTLLLVGSGSTGCHPQLHTDAPRPDPPDAPIQAVGNGELVSAHFGPAGGTLELGAGGPGVALPKNKWEGGLSLTLRRAEPKAVAGVRSFGPGFNISRSVLPPSGEFIGVSSVQLSSVNPSCQPDAIALALEGPAPAGAPEGQGFTWRFESTKLVEGRATAQLPKLEPLHMQFVCKER
jgi:hypothetical protein